MDRFWLVAPAAGILFLAGCKTSQPVAVQAAEKPPAAAVLPGSKLIRATGTIRAVRASTIQVPYVQSQQGNRQTLLRLILNGSTVKSGDIIAEFDRTAQMDQYREAKAKYEDLSHQVRQKEAQGRSDAEKRLAEIKEAEADLAKAEIQLKKGPILAEIDRLKNQAKAESAKERVASLRRTHEYRAKAEAASVEILRLQMLRQKLVMDRSQSNAEKLVLKAPIEGMVALETVWRMGSMGPPQEGDKLWGGQPLLKIFDPREMEVHTLIGEPDGAVLKEGTVAIVHLDAYPEAIFKAAFQSASPVATSALGSPIKNFSARFRLSQTDARLLPDLSAAVIIEPEAVP